MNQLDIDDVVQYVEQNIGAFHQKRIQGLDSLRLTQVLRRKNPYLFKAKYVFAPEQFVKGLVTVRNQLGGLARSETGQSTKLITDKH